MDVKEHFYFDDPQVGHPDSRTNPPNCVYYFLGNGHIQAAIQVNRSGNGTPLGLLFMPPEKFGKKREALNFHPERGIEDSQIHLLCDGREYKPDLASLQVRWEKRNRVPVVIAEWCAGAIAVHEEFYCPSLHEPHLRRAVTLQNQAAQDYHVEVWTAVPEAQNVPAQTWASLLLARIKSANHHRLRI
jgi:hypothetical protein